jgi:hypothetical protein
VSRVAPGAAALDPMEKLGNGSIFFADFFGFGDTEAGVFSIVCGAASFDGKRSAVRATTCQSSSSSGRKRRLIGKSY